MKRFSIAIIAMMLLLPGLSSAADQPAFEGGLEEVVVSLDAPDYLACVNVTVPAGFRAGNAAMKVTGMAAMDNASAYPEDVTIRLNESLVWAFQGKGYGQMGRQDRFSGGQERITSFFGTDGGINAHYIRVPKEATVQSAVMDVKRMLPAAGPELVNFTGAAQEDMLGSVSGAGDVNNDGYDDIIVGAWSNDAGGDNAGRAYIFHGGKNMDSVADLVITGGFSGEQFGTTVSDAGDMDRDGYDDVLVGAPGNNTGGTQAGRACLFLGGKDMDGIADATFFGAAGGDALGGSVSGAGDVNKDGYGDVLAGAKKNDAGGKDAGRVYVHSYFVSNLTGIPNPGISMLQYPGRTSTETLMSMCR